MKTVPFFLRGIIKSSISYKTQFFLEFEFAREARGQTIIGYCSVYGAGKSLGKSTFLTHFEGPSFVFECKGVTVCTVTIPFSAFLFV